MRLTLYCKCGAAGVGSIEPKAAAEKFTAIFWEAHRDPGCGPTDAETARKARAKAERAYFDEPKAKASE